MNLGFIDADLLDNGSKFPNLALMKLSGYYKNEGCNVTLLENYNKIDKYDKVFISKVFDCTRVPNLEKYDNIEIGGSGFFWDKAPLLPYEIEHCKPNYNLYEKYIEKKIMFGDNKNKYYSYLNSSIGFLTRGCFRKCDFCINHNCNKVEKHSDLSEFYDENKYYIELLDDNILGYANWKEELETLVKTNKRVRFLQGLDIRILTDEKAYLLDKLKYNRDYTFAFDNIKDKDIITEKIKVWQQNSTKNIRFYVLVGYFGNGIEDIINTFERIKILTEFGCCPYIMKHKNYEKSEFKELYALICSWCNQRNMFLTKSFKEFCLECKGQRGKVKRVYNNFVKKYPLIEKEYFDIKFNR